MAALSSLLIQVLLAAVLCTASLNMQVCLASVPGSPPADTLHALHKVDATQRGTSAATDATPAAMPSSGSIPLGESYSAGMQAASTLAPGRATGMQRREGLPSVLTVATDEQRQATPSPWQRQVAGSGRPGGSGSRPQQQPREGGIAHAPSFPSHSNLNPGWAEIIPSLPRMSSTAFRALLSPIADMAANSYRHSFTPLRPIPGWRLSTRVPVLAPEVGAHALVYEEGGEVREVEGEGEGGEVGEGGKGGALGWEVKERRGECGSGECGSAGSPTPSALPRVVVAFRGTVLPANSSAPSLQSLADLCADALLFGALGLNTKEEEEGGGGGSSSSEDAAAVVEVNGGKGSEAPCEERRRDCSTAASDVAGQPSPSPHLPPYCRQFSLAALDYYSQAVALVKEVIKAYPPSTSILLTGHSLGGGLSLLASAALSASPSPPLSSHPLSSSPRTRSPVLDGSPALLPVIAFSAPTCESALSARSLSLSPLLSASLAFEVADCWDPLLHLNSSHHSAALCLYSTAQPRTCMLCYRERRAGAVKEGEKEGEEEGEEESAAKGEVKSGRDNSNGGSNRGTTQQVLLPPLVPLYLPARCLPCFFATHIFKHLLQLLHTKPRPECTATATTAVSPVEVALI